MPDKLPHFIGSFDASLVTLPPGVAEHTYIFSTRIEIEIKKKASSYHGKGSWVVPSLFV
jgi:hypothetical protein